MSFNQGGAGFVRSGGGVSGDGTGITDAVAFRTAIDAEESRLCQTNLARWKDRLLSNVAPVIAINGDSVIAQSFGQLSTLIGAQIGTAGIGFIQSADSGGAVPINDPAVWFLWGGSRLSGSGHTATVTSTAGGVTANTLKL